MTDWAGGWEIWVGLATSLITTFFALLAWERKPAARLPIVLVGIAAVTIVLLGPVPRWQAEGAKESPTDPNAALTVENEFRKTMATILAGVFVLGSGILAWMNIRVAQANVEVAQSNAEITAQGHITDRFTKAIEQLGATTAEGKPHLEVRLGGIYALERIARDSVERDHAVIMEVLTAYVRENAPAPTEPTPGDAGGRLVLPKPRTDIQAILTVLGRRTEQQRKQELQPLDLRATDLRRFDLRGAHLAGATLRGAHLEGADLRGTHLEGADLRGTHLEGAILGGAHLGGADLRAAKGLTQVRIDTTFMDEKTTIPDAVGPKTGEPLRRSSRQPD